MRVGLALAMGMAMPAAAAAHALDIAYLRIEPVPAAADTKVMLDLDLAAAGLLLDVSPATLDAFALTAKADQLAAQSFARELPTTPAGPCKMSDSTIELVAPSVHLSATLTCPPGPRTWRFPFVTDARIPATFQLLVKEVAADRLTVVDKAAPALELSTEVVAVAEDGSAARIPVATHARPGRTTLVVGGALIVLVLGALAYLAPRKKRHDT